jgi:hypothetical protein
MAIRNKQASEGVLRAEITEQVEALARQCRQSLYGPEGVPAWGTKFTEIETAGVEIGDAVARAIIRQAVAEQAAGEEAKPGSCGCCGHPLEGNEPHPHLLRTRRGDVPWVEPSGYCAQCRKAFFPSGPTTGD